MAADAGVHPRGLPSRVLTGFAIVAAAGLLAVTVRLSPPDRPVDEPPPVDAVQVGVVDGQSVPAYLTATRSELAALAGGTPVWALISLDSYLTPQRLQPLLGGSAVAQIYTRVPQAGTRSQVVRITVTEIPRDVVSGMLGAAQVRDQERADYEQLGRNAPAGRLRMAYEFAAQLAAAEAAAYRAQCACVFAAVVRASPGTLTSIAARPGVRAVDPAPEVNGLERAEFRPPWPEQRTTVLEETRTATGSPPAAVSSVAAAASAPLPSSSGAPAPSPFVQARPHPT